MRKITTRLEVKDLSGSGEFEGYGSVFGNKDSQGDVVVKGAFKRSLEKHRGSNTSPRLLLHHDNTRPCGVYTAMTEDNIGLYVKGRLLLDTQDGAEAFSLLKAGALDGLSIGYNSVDSEYDPNTGVNFLREVDLWEISLVTFPSNESARVAAVKTVRDFEKFLRDKGGYSRNMAKSIACRGFRGSSSAHIDMDTFKNLIEKNIRLLGDI